MKRGRMIEYLTEVIKDGKKMGCEDYTFVVDRNAESTFVITCADETKAIIQAVRRLEKISKLDNISKIYYHKMSCLDVLVVGILTSESPIECILEKVI